MNATRQIFLGTALLAALLPTAQAACNANIPLTRPDSRYTDNTDGTVTDTVTGLMWMQCPEGLSTTTTACDTGSAATYTWQGALARAKAVNDGGGFAGHADWRLPNLKELKSLAEVACYSPAINTNLFPNTPGSRFWSSSPVASVTYFAWDVYFSFGGGGWAYKDNACHVRLVRAGQ